jgi:XRE family transcriptional regulator, master regulator for biofilm formation
MKSLGERFKELRKSKKYSQDEIADRLGVSKAFISLIENGLRDPSVELLNKAASLFDVDVADFYEYKIQSPEDLSREGLKWIMFGEELKDKGINIEQVREWVKAIRAFEEKK